MNRILQASTAPCLSTVLRLAGASPDLISYVQVHDQTGPTQCNMGEKIR